MLNRLSSISIENTIQSCNSAIRAKIHTLFYPGEYTSFTENDEISNDIFKSVKTFFEES